MQPIETVNRELHGIDKDLAARVWISLCATRDEIDHILVGQPKDGIRRRNGGGSAQMDLGGDGRINFRFFSLTLSLFFFFFLLFPPFVPLLSRAILRFIWNAID
jgi:hypothetical protein